MTKDEKNAAWVQAEMPLSAEQLLEFLAATERLWRMNPYLAIESWRSENDDEFSFVAANESNDCRLDLAVKRAVLPGRGFLFSYDKGLKRTTEFIVESKGMAALLTVTECYEAVADPADPRVKESDKSLVPWVASLRRHLVARSRWSVLPGWLWWSERFLPSMPPSQRRTVRLIVWATVIEFVIFFALVLFWQFAA